MPDAHANLGVALKGLGRLDGQLRTLVGHWRDTAAMPDAALADLVRTDGIDILVDLASHTAQNRLLTLTPIESAPLLQQALTAHV